MTGVDEERTELRQHITDALAPTLGYDQASAQAGLVTGSILNLVEALVDARLNQHLEVDPHLYPDGSSH